MNRKRRNTSRSYRISVHAKPKKIKTSNVQENGTPVSHDPRNEGQAQDSLFPNLPDGNPPPAARPPSPSVLPVVASARPVTDVRPVNLDAPTEPVESLIQAPPATHQSEPTNSPNLQPHTTNAATLPKDVKLDEPANPAVATELDGAGDVLLDGPSNGDTDGRPAGDGDDHVGANPDSPPDSLMIFSCVQCQTIVSDSSTGYNFSNDRKLLSVRGAQSVKISDAIEVSKSGPDLRCTYHTVTCSRCDARLGKVYSTTIMQFDHHRGVFTLDTDRLATYCVGDLHTPEGEDVSSLATKLPLLTPLSTNHPSLDAFEDLDEHVNTVTDAVNNVTDAIRDIRRVILDIRAELNATKAKVNDGEDALSKLHSVVSLWESRQRKTQTSEHHMAPIIPLLRSMEKRIRLVENRVSPAFTTTVPQITDAMHSAPSPNSATPSQPRSLDNSESRRPR